MIGSYTLGYIAYGVHHRGVQSVDLIDTPSDKYMGKDRAHGSGLINLYPGSRRQLMDPGAVQKDSHTPGAQKMIRWTNFVYICLFYSLCQH